MINGAQTNQIIEGFGVNLNYQGWTNNDLKPVIDALVDQAQMTLFRVVFDNTDWEGTNDNSNPEAMNWNYYNTIYSSPRFQQLWGLLGYLNQKGISNGIVLNFQGPGPVWMGGNTLVPGDEDEWAETIASLLYYARNTQNLQFTLVAPDNEPDDPPQGIGINGYTQYVTMLHNLALKLDTNGMSDVRFIAPDLAWTDTNFMTAIMTDPVVMAKVAHFGLHSYWIYGAGSGGVNNFIKQSAYPKVTYWMTEFNVWCYACQNGQLGTYDWAYCEGTAQYLFPHLGGGASAGIVWEAYDSLYYINGPQWSFWGLFGVDDTNAVQKTYTPRKNFYTFSQFSKFVLPGAYSINPQGNAAPFGALEAFWQPGTGQFTIVGVNTDAGPKPLAVTLASLPRIPSLELYYTDPSSNLVHLAPVPVTNGTSFTAMIPANCVFTLVGGSAVFASISNLAYTTQFAAPANIPIQASVSAGVGTAGQVNFFNGASNIGTATSPPYSIVWSNAPPGNYILTAIASNSLGNTITSPTVNVTVAGPLAQIRMRPANVTVAAFNTQQFIATGVDAFGTVLNPQPALVRSAAGGIIDSNGLFTADDTFGGPFAVTASSGSLTASASVTVLNLTNNLAYAGTGHTWHSLSDPSQNSPIATAPRVNDGDLATDFPLAPNGQLEASQAWEAAGLTWKAPQSIGIVTYINGSYDQYDDGVFDTNFGLQFSPDGSTWTNAGPEWTVSPAYGYNSAADAGVSFNFTGGRVTAKGVRCVGLVRTAETGQNSWIAFAREVQVYPPPPPPVLQAGWANNGVVISWIGSATNYYLEATTNSGPPYVWSALANAAQLISNQQQVNITPPANRQFFRLQRR